MVIAVGGSSIIDCAKAIAFLALNEGDINDFIFGVKVGTTALPLILIPTTCGTGSECNGFAVLTNPENGDKKSLRSNAIIPTASIVDPDCMMTMPKRVLASVGFDAFCHNMEAYTSKNSQPFTDAFSLYALSLITDVLPRLYKKMDTVEKNKVTYNGANDATDWEKLSLASAIGGMVIGTVGVTLSHGMEHPVSGLKDVIHGHGLSALTPAVVRASYHGNREKFGRIARLLSGFTAEDCASRIEALLKEINLNITLTELGIKHRDIAWMVENCLKTSIPSIAANPVEFDASGLTEIYKDAL